MRHQQLSLAQNTSCPRAADSVARLLGTWSSAARSTLSSPVLWSGLCYHMFAIIMYPSLAHRAISRLRDHVNDPNASLRASGLQSQQRLPRISSRPESMVTPPELAKAPTPDA